MRVAEPALATATWEFEVTGEDKDEARANALVELRAEVGEQAFEALWRDRDDWNATPRALQGMETERKEAKGGG